MKFIKMRIYRNCTEAKTSYTYPIGYDAKKVIYGPIYQADAKNRFPGTDFQHIIIGVRDTDAEQFLTGSYGKDVPETWYINAIQITGYVAPFEITVEEAKAQCDEWVPQVTRMQNQDTIMLILAKVARGEELTQLEKDAINPESDVVGIGKTQSQSERIDEVIVKHG